MSRKVLIAWEHGGNLGHLGRLLPVALALRMQGCDVEFAVADAVAGVRFLTPAGFRWRLGPARIPQSSGEGQALNHADILLRCGLGMPTASVASLIRQWQLVLKDSRASSVLVDASPMALYAARSAGLHTVGLGHGFEIPPPGQPGPCFAPWAQDASILSRGHEKRLADCLDALATHLGSPAAPRTTAELYSPGSSALCTWPELDHFERPQDAAATLYIGPIWTELPGAEAYAFPGQAGPKVLAYLNPVDKRYDLLWQALRRIGANVLVLSPGGRERACEAARGWGVHVVERPVLLAPLLQECDAVIGHGGMGLSSMALQGAKPLLLLPEHTEQAILAHRLHKRGLATATIRYQDKINMQERVAALLSTADSNRALSEFAASYTSFTPSQAVDSLVSKLVGFALQ